MNFTKHKSKSYGSSVVVVFGSGGSSVSNRFSFCCQPWLGKSTIGYHSKIYMQYLVLKIGGEEDYQLTGTIKKDFASNFLR